MNGKCLLTEERETLAMILRQEGLMSRKQGLKIGREQNYLSREWIALAYKLSLTPDQELTSNDVWLLGMLALDMGSEATWTQTFVKGEGSEAMTEQKLREKIAQELFDVWKEAKESCSDRWADVTWESLPENHKREYILTAKRILALHREAGWKSPEELKDGEA